MSTFTIDLLVNYYKNVLASYYIAVRTVIWMIKSTLAVKMKTEVIMNVRF